jgi:hypothetical protein
MSLNSISRRTLLLGWVVLFLAGSGVMAGSASAQGRIIRASNTATAVGVESQIEVRILLDSQGDESSIAFSLNFNPSTLTNPVASRGIDLPAGSEVSFNTAALGQGRLGVVINAPSSLAAGTRSIVNVLFTVPGTASIGSTPLSFGDVPTARLVTNSTGGPLSTIYETGVVTIGTADGVGVAGRVLTPDGAGIRNATVVAIDSRGNRSFATTGSFGNFIIPYIRLTERYTIAIRSKRYRFAPQLIQVFSSAPNLTFVGLE